jgi:hypothetical protein
MAKPIVVYGRHADHARRIWHSAVYEAGNTGRDKADVFGELSSNPSALENVSPGDGHLLDFLGLRNLVKEYIFLPVNDTEEIRASLRDVKGVSALVIASCMHANLQKGLDDERALMRLQEDWCRAPPAGAGEEGPELKKIRNESKRIRRTYWVNPLEMFAQPSSRNGLSLCVVQFGPYINDDESQISYFPGDSSKPTVVRGRSSEDVKRWLDGL